MRMSCTREAFGLEASVRAFDGDEEICHREWNQSARPGFALVVYYAMC